MHYNNSPAAAVAPVDKSPQWCRQLVAEAPEAGTGLMLVSPFDKELLSLLDILRRPNWSIYWSRNCVDATAMLRDNTVAVVLCDSDLPEGSWQKLLALVNSLSKQPRFILIAHVADESLWAEALNRGAYDVLAKPYEAAEVIRVISLACRSWDSEHAKKKAIATAAADD